MNSERTRRGWAWPPLVPRPVLVVAWVIFNGITALSIAIDLIQSPAEMPLWAILWEAIGGDASGVCYWALLGSYLYSEAIAMILTKWANQARVEQALEQGRAEGRSAENRQWQEYLDRRAAAEKAGLPFNEPRPQPPDTSRDAR